MEKYGYCRVSTTEQNEERQLLVMKKLGISPTKIFIDKQSGKDFNRPQYKAMLDILRPGDLLHITSIDRLGRNYEDIQNQWRVLTKELKVDIAVHDMQILDTRNGKDLVGTFLADTVLAILSFVAQNEREAIQKRQAEGIEVARMKGIHLGRPIKQPPANFDKLAEGWRHGEMTIKELAQRTGLTEPTLRRRLREKGITKKKQPPVKRSTF